MAETTHDLPHIGRDEIVERLLARLCRPDDLRESQQEFIHPGFYGLGGVGKSRLLREVMERARAERLTPYRLLVDFDPRAPIQPPATPLQFVQRLIDGLEEIDKAERPFWQRAVWGRVNPFRECRRLIGEMTRQPNIQTIEAKDSVVKDVSLSIQGSGQQVTPALAAAFGQALAELCADGVVEQRYGLRTATPRPLVLLALDTVEAAPRELRRWLEQEIEQLWPGNGLRAHVLVAAAGRQRMTRLIEQPLPPLDEDDAGRFLVNYALLRRQQGAIVHESNLSRLREPTPLRGELIRLGEGIPLLLMLLCDLFLDAPTAFAALPDLPAAHEQRVAYVINHYLNRLQQQAGDQADERLWDRYRLLWAGAVPRRLEGAGLLQALLSDLPGTPYTAAANYDELYLRLARQSFVSDLGREGLVYHQLVREGVLEHLRQSDRARWQALHSRAAAWYAAQNNPRENLYHRLQADPEGVWREMRGAIESALTGGDWPGAPGLIAAAAESDLPGGASPWLTLYNADLAWGEGNRLLAQARLNELAMQRLDSETQEALARRLESWFDLADRVDTEKEDEGGTPPGMVTNLFLWWAQLRGHERIVAHALRGQAASARAQDQYAEAGRLYREALAISRRIGDQLGEAHVLRGQAESARALSQYADAQSYMENCVAIAHAIGIPAAGLSWCVWLGHRALDAVEAHARQKEAAQTAAARHLAQDCYAWATDFVRDPNLPAAGQRYVQSYQSLGVRLAS